MSLRPLWSLIEWLLDRPAARARLWSEIQGAVIRFRGPALRLCDAPGDLARALRPNLELTAAHFEPRADHIATSDRGDERRRNARVETIKATHYFTAVSPQI
ncbi:hypothetical protein EYF80_005647 [Liparis tanakae]|uniref:Uncharacterized protein n=1 Tax=Liparis tanakae TaxID=230148 RepID=A0A4Z2J266_9TELE|nr:hypothetical protein EYF80_005647 [Liparis tanakae]